MVKDTKQGFGKQHPQLSRFGKRPEQLDVEQMQLVIEDLEQTMGAGAAAGEARAETEAQAGQPSSTRPARRQRNLGQLPASLPRFEVVIDLEDKSCPCCRGELHCIGESRAEMLDILPAQLRMKVICRPRYICQACDRPELATMLKTQNISKASSMATITAVNYAGDEGGILCRLEIPPNENAIHVSITHLRFDPRLPGAREITAYQKHRPKHLKRQESKKLQRFTRRHSAYRHPRK